MSEQRMPDSVWLGRNFENRITDCRALNMHSGDGSCSTCTKYVLASRLERAEACLREIAKEPCSWTGCVDPDLCCFKCVTTLPAKPCLSCKARAYFAEQKGTP